MIDTYPIRDKSSKPLDWYKLFLYVVIFILVWFFVKLCGETPEPIVITGKQVHDTIQLIEAKRKHISDSFIIVLSEKERQIEIAKSNYDELMADYRNMQNDLTSSFNNEKYPDTCSKIVNLLSVKYNNLKAANDKKDAAANNVIKGLNNQVATQKNFLKQKDLDYAKMKSIADTCSKSLTAMGKYADKIKPKREVNGGVSGMANYAGNLNPAIGITLGYRTKKGFDISAAVYSNNVATITIKKTIFKF